VHRDLKPENLLVTPDGRVKILDFGLAKLIQDPEAIPPGSGALTLDQETKPGTLLGTVGYMSPEQVRGEAADPRSDIFSLGSPRGPGGPSQPGPDREAVPREGRARALPVRAGHRPRPGNEPLQDLSGPSAQDYFADGLTEALITDLAKARSLKVISRTSVMQYKEVKKPLPEIARELGVEAIIEGSVLRSGDRVRITAQLIDASTDQHLWAEEYEGDIRDVLALQRDVARSLA
jgi:TolB-like protein